MYRRAQCVSTSHCTVWSLFITRTRVGQDCTPLCPKTFRHPRVMSSSLPQLTLTTSTSSLSPTSPIFQSSSSAHPSLFVVSRSIFTLRQFTAELRFHGSPISHRLLGQKVEPDWNLEVEHQDQSNTRQNYGRWLSKFNHWRYGRIWKIGVKSRAQQSVTDTLRLRFSRKHCWRRPRRRTITWDAGFTAVY